MLDMEADPTVNHLRRLWLYLYCLAVAVFLLAPILVVIPMSFSPSEFLEFPPSALSLRWYQSLFNSAEWTGAALISLKAAVLTVLVATPLGIAASYGLQYSEMGVAKLVRSALIGRYEGTTPGMPALLVGSHIDTVRQAGKYDGTLGVLAALTAVEVLSQAGERLPFAIEVVAFGDEEGVRFPSTLRGSRALAGTLDRRRGLTHAHPSRDGELDLVGGERIDRHNMILAEVGCVLRADAVFLRADAEAVEAADYRAARARRCEGRRRDARLVEQSRTERAARRALDLVLLHHDHRIESVGDERRQPRIALGRRGLRMLACIVLCICRAARRTLLDRTWRGDDDLRQRHFLRARGLCRKRNGGGGDGR